MRCRWSPSSSRECERRAAGRPVQLVRVRHASSIPEPALRQAFRMLTEGGTLADATLEAETFDVGLRLRVRLQGALGHDDLIGGSVAVCPACGDVSTRRRTAELELLEVRTAPLRPAWWALDRDADPDGACAGGSPDPRAVLPSCLRPGTRVARTAEDRRRIMPLRALGATASMPDHERATIWIPERRQHVDQRYECLDGNEAAARVAYAVSEVISIYPITPGLADGRALRRLVRGRAAEPLGRGPGRRRDAVRGRRGRRAARRAAEGRARRRRSPRRRACC